MPDQELLSNNNNNSAFNIKISDDNFLDGGVSDHKFLSKALLFRLTIHKHAIKLALDRDESLIPHDIRSNFDKSEAQIEINSMLPLIDEKQIKAKLLLIDKEYLQTQPKFYFSSKFGSPISS